MSTSDGAAGSSGARRPGVRALGPRPRPQRSAAGRSGWDGRMTSAGTGEAPSEARGEHVPSAVAVMVIIALRCGQDRAGPGGPGGGRPAGRREAAGGSRLWVGAGLRSRRFSLFARWFSVLRGVGMRGSCWARECVWAVGRERGRETLNPSWGREESRSEGVRPSYCRSQSPFSEKIFISCSILCSAQGRPRALWEAGRQQDVGRARPGPAARARLGTSLLC